MSIDELFTPNETKTSEQLSGNQDGRKDYVLWTPEKYADWVVANVTGRPRVSFDIELNGTGAAFTGSSMFPDGRDFSGVEQLPDTQFYSWIADRICGTLDAAGIDHSIVNFDIETYRSYRSLRIRTFIDFPPSFMLFAKTYYKLYLIAYHCSRCTHLYTKIRCGYYQPQLDAHYESSVTVSVDYLDRMNELCDFLYLLQHLIINSFNKDAEKLDFYNHFFSFKLFNKKLYIYTRDPMYIAQRADDIVHDICVMNGVVYETLLSFRKYENRYSYGRLDDERIKFAKWFWSRFFRPMFSKDVRLAEQTLYEECLKLLASTKYSSCGREV